MVLISLLSGIATAAAFYSPYTGFLCFFSLIPIFYLLIFKTTGKRQAVKCCLLFALSFYMVSLLWLWGLYPITNFEISRGAGFALVAAAWILLSLFMAAELAAGLYIVWRINPPKKLYPWLLGCMFVILEFVQGLGSLGFTWGRIGLSQAFYPFVIRSAALLGPLFISFVVVTVAAFFAVALGTKSKRFTGAAVLIFCINIIIGFCMPDFGGQEVSVSMVWENVDNEHKMHQNISKVLGGFERKSTEAAKAGQADFILWTETAIPADHSKHKYLFDRYADIAEQSGAVLISAGFDRQDGKKYSAMFYTNPDRSYAGSTYKRHLVPFGEYIPARKWLDRLFPELMAGVRSAGEELNFYKGESTVKTHKGRVGGLVCYDSAMQNLSRDSVREGAEILMLSVNDSWFAGTSMISRHLSQAVFRAVETGRYIVRSANQGISAVIAPDGRVVVSTQEGEYLKGRAQLVSRHTPYTYIGDVIVLICAAAAAAIFFRRNKPQRGE